MSKLNKPVLSEKTNTGTKFIKNILNNENILLQNSPNNLINDQSSKLLSIKSKTEKHNQLKIEINLNSKNKTNINITGPIKGETDPEKQLLYFFKDKKIYIEIFNGNLNASPTFFNLLEKYKIIQCKKLSKKIDYIIFKDGHLKTKKYAVLNNIKMVNPLWIDDKINKHIFKDDKEYEIKTNFGDIVIREKYEKNRNDKNTNKDKDKEKEEFLDKNYDLELEAEYDTEYANMIDKLRENNLEKNNNSEITTNIIDEINEENLFEMEDKNKNVKNKKNDINEDVKREKRKISSNKLENRKTITNINKDKEDCQTNPKERKGLKNISNNVNISKKNNSKNQNKKGKNKKNKSFNHRNSSDKENEQNQKISEKKKSDKKEKNYILEFNQDNGNILSIPTKPEIQSTSEKINIMTYKLEEKEIQCLKTLNNFEYKGNLNDNNENDKSIYINASVIILEQKKVKYDSKMYEFLLDKKIVVDFTSFLLEFISADNTENIDSNKLIDKINEISINNEFFFFNKKKRMQKRTMMQSLNIIDNIMSKEKNEQVNQHQNDIENKFYFIIHQDINESEKRIFHKLLKNYLKANIINTNVPKNCSRSVTNQINLNLQKMTKKTKKNNLEVIQENQLEKDDKNIKNENKKELNEIDKSKNSNEKNINNSNVNNNIKINDDNKMKCNNNEEQIIEGTYLISKDKVNNIKFLKKVKFYKGIISYKYIYDSFSNGQLLDLNEQKIFEKYKLQ